jgi:hypothetical protein
LKKIIHSTLRRHFQPGETLSTNKNTSPYAASFSWENNTVSRPKNEVTLPYLCTHEQHTINTNVESKYSPATACFFPKKYYSFLFGKITTTLLAGGNTTTFFCSYSGNKKYFTVYRLFYPEKYYNLLPLRKI